MPDVDAGNVVGAGLDEAATMDAGAVLGRGAVVVVVVEGADEEEVVAADFTLSPRGRASTPVDRFCNRIDMENLKEAGRHQNSEAGIKDGGYLRGAGGQPES